MGTGSLRIALHVTEWFASLLGAIVAGSLAGVVAHQWLAALGIHVEPVAMVLVSFVATLVFLHVALRFVEEDLDRLAGYDETDREAEEALRPTARSTRAG